MKKTILFWVGCVIFFIFWKIVFSTDVAKNVLGGNVVPSQHLNTAQIKQIEDIAIEIAKQSNASKNLHLDDMTVDFNAVASGRNVRFEYVLRVKNGLSADEIREWLVEAKSELITPACKQNINNPAFDRGLSYILAYTSIHGQKLGDIFIDKEVCKQFGF